jgi:ribulose-phosphate 3-epimerase
MRWSDVRAVEVEPSLYAADFARLGEQIDELLRAGASVFHYDVGDGQFVEPIIVGPIVLRSIGDRIHAGGGGVDVHLMIESPERHFAAFREAGADSVTFHYEAVEDVGATAGAAREHGLGVGIAFKPATPVADVAEAALAAEIDLVLCMSIEPGYSGQEFMADAYGRIRETRQLLVSEVPLQIDGGIDEANIGAVRDAGVQLFVAGASIFSADDIAGAYRGLVAAAR